MDKGPIWLVDDDVDDYGIVKEIFTELGVLNELVWFPSAEDVLSGLEKSTEAPFIVICDVNLTKINGFKLRELMLEQPDKKFHSVPFIYWSTFASDEQIEHAYNLAVHGFFIKETSFEKMKSSIQLIMAYWQNSRVPKADTMNKSPKVLK